ncbi:M23 family metallopeptidase [Profundibacterium mesophilum]|uniref:Hydroxypyruvate isomerase n=1 Tax=Profundibacterium mesophilum KAUST100406-0324 TaxID=1037889 RepID=A0A921NUP6_9RHOB|nr:M23 family metallopeptidase [Profundibacterium mesophilum]KAF0675129.1 hydroxypyruvate isomerase [Profundibacterium mesophilum KAUST100406-0324]
MPAFAIRPRPAMAAIALVTLAGCAGGFDMDMRDSISNSAFDTSADVPRAVRPRPQPDARGVISYSDYQVAVARHGEKVGEIAARLGLPADELARFNGLPMDTPLRNGEIIALPRRVDGGTPAGVPAPAPLPAPSAPRQAAPVYAGTTAPAPTERIDVSSLDDVPRGRPSAAPQAAPPETRRETPAVPATPRGTDPVRHRVERGETAYTIARLYDVPVSALAEWNGLGGDLSVREGQHLLIPVRDEARRETPPVRQSAPGEGTPTPVPPSAGKPLPPRDEPVTAPEPAPPSPELKAEVTEASKPAATSGRMSFPVDGPVIRPYQKKKNDGIDIGATAGTPVRAAADGEVAAITRDTDQVPILVLRHPGNLLTVYAGVDAISVSKGDRISRGQTVAKVRGGTPSFVHFEVREGFESVDPVPYLQ